MKHNKKDFQEYVLIVLNNQLKRHSVDPKIAYEHTIDTLGIDIEDKEYARYFDEVYNQFTKDNNI